MKQTDTAESLRSRCLMVLILLVGSSVGAIAASVSLNHWTNSSYADAIETNRRWARRVELISELETLANAVNGPANDVFGTGNAPAEMAEQKIAHQNFLKRKSAIHDEILKDLRHSLRAPMHKGLADAADKVEQVNAEAEATLKAFGAGDAKLAGAHMAAMDRAMRALTQVILAMQATARDTQQANFDAQSQKAGRARDIEKLMGIGIGTLVVWLGIYGLKLYRLTSIVAAGQRRAEEGLAAARDAAETANRTKSEFLANMSHEIRTPITAIVGFSDMMLDADQTQSDRFDGLQTIRRNARHLLELINDILDISKIEAGKMTVERIESDLPLLLCEVMSMLQPRALEKNIELLLILDTPVSRMINTDPLRLKQVLVNLLGNAIKFTPGGHVHLRIAHPDQAGPLYFSIVDSGIGMTEAQRARLFQPFTQADGSTTRKFGGSGLGLTISKRLAELLGGDIAVLSQPGKGSTFKAWIDAGAIAGPMLTTIEQTLLHPEDAKARDDIDSIKLRGRILLAEDGADNQRFISAMLRCAGAEVVIAVNGKIAVEMALAQSFDLVFMDMQMPVMDGYSAASKLRSRGSELPIVALTAHAMAEDRGRCIQAGCTDYLTKPIDRAKLVRTAAKYLTRSTSNDEGAKAIDDAPRALQPPAINTGALTSSFADDPVMKEILLEYISNLPVQVARIQQFIAEEQAAELHEAVHQIKGAGGTYGFNAITAMAAGLESRLKAGEEVNAVYDDIESLLRLIRSVDGYDPAAECASEEEVDHAETSHD